jgi:hypothetical protein
VARFLADLTISQKQGVCKMTDFVINSPFDSSFDSSFDSLNHSPDSSDRNGVDHTSAAENRHPLRGLLISSEQDVRETIKNLHRRDFAEATLWSRIMTYPNREAIDHLLPVRSDSVVSILTKYLTH